MLFEEIVGACIRLLLLFMNEILLSLASPKNVQGHVGCILSGTWHVR